MIHHGASWRKKARFAALVLTVAALPSAYFDGAAVQAQSIMRSPNLNIGARVPTMTVTPRINPNVGGLAVTGIDRTGNLRTRPACSYAYRDADGGCSGQPGASTGGGGGAASAKNKSSGPRRNVAQ